MWRACHLKGYIIGQEAVMEATARVIPLNGKPQQLKVATGDAPPAPAAAPTVPLEFGALEGVLVRMPDEQLDALGAIFCASPLRRVMTFEGYLVVRGFGFDDV
jgi:hypothetical protein